MSKVSLLSLIALVALSACSTDKPIQKTPTTKTAVNAAKTVAAKTPEQQLDAAISNPARAAKERARDVYRNPKKTLQFFEVKPSSHVLELWPGRGWYTKILVPYVGQSGKYYATDSTMPTTPEKYKKRAEDYNKMLMAMPQAANLKIVKVDTTPEKLSFGMDGKLDVILTFRNVHNWAKGGYDAAMYKAAFAALKPGGIFGVVEHRAKDGTTREQSIASGYMDQKQVIDAVKAAGFELVATSEINANAKDTKDHPKGVWTLPPALRLGETDQAKYKAIGESDRMTLKFRKPK